MFELLSRFSPGELAIVLCVPLVVLVAVLVPLARVVTDTWRKYRERELATSLVLEMLVQGMGSEEITRVLEAADMEDHQEHVSALKRKFELACAQGATSVH
jgi:sulfite reductase beta subunit-like hemoprotein